MSPSAGESASVASPALASLLAITQPAKGPRDVAALVGEASPRREAGNTTYAVDQFTGLPSYK